MHGRKGNRHDAPDVQKSDALRRGRFEALILGDKKIIGDPRRQFSRAP
jgi:hypothetical protein